MESMSEKDDFPRIDTNASILLIAPAYLTKDNNNHRNSFEKGFDNLSQGTKWVDKVMNTIKGTGIETDIITFPNDKTTNNAIQREVATNSFGISKEENLSTNSTIKVDLGKAKYSNYVKKENEYAKTGDGYLSIPNDSVKEQIKKRRYSLVVIIGVNDNEVINEVFQDIRRELPSESTKFLFDSYHAGNCIKDSHNATVGGVSDPSRNIVSKIGESIFVYSRKDSNLESFDQSVDAVRFAATVFTLAIGVSFEKISRLLSCKTIYATAMENTPLNTVKLIRKYGRVIHDKEGLIQLKALINQAGKKIALTTGCFDIFHAGHAAMLEEAKEQADVFIVALNSDESVRQLKGPTRPICKLQKRMHILLSLKSVDFIVLFSEKRPDWIIDILRPDVFVKGPECSEEALRKSFPQLRDIHITGNTFDIHTSTIVEVCRKYCYS